ncbi:hypothetical protein KPH14_008205 [Odynerus spinipes]|uniref:Uncharacterized protein n=1 Tax=Odynerus spinipes TaxID=1348599 RepID=A0AAD9RGE0_9HYME|nr:hypothetical protein KPH14_008205 [Odynerus spinipes]
MSILNITFLQIKSMRQNYSKFYPTLSIPNTSYRSEGDFITKEKDNCVYLADDAELELKTPWCYPIFSAPMKRA